MQFKYSIVKLASFLVVASSLTASIAASVKIRAANQADSPGVKFCTGTDYHGMCNTYTDLTSGGCVTLGSDLIRNVKSMDLASQTTCNLYEAENCSGNPKFLAKDHKDLSEVNYDDKAVSFSCSGP